MRRPRDDARPSADHATAWVAPRDRRLQASVRPPPPASPGAASGDRGWRRVSALVSVSCAISHEPRGAWYRRCSRALRPSRAGGSPATPAARKEDGEMRSHPFWRVCRGATLCALLALSMTATAMAQSQTGNVYGDVMDDKGQPLPGVTVTLSGGGAPVVQVTDAQGNFRFVGVYPGTYRLEGALDGFSPVESTNVVVEPEPQHHALADHERRGRRDDHDHGGVAAARRAQDLDRRHGRQDRAREDADRPRPVGHPADHAGRAHRPRQRRRQRERPAVAATSATATTARNSTWSIDGVEITDMSARSGSVVVLRLRRVRGDAGHDRRLRRDHARPAASASTW